MKNTIHTLPFDSKSSDRVYEVKVYEDFTTSCNCPGWTFKKAGRERGCTHTEYAGRMRIVWIGREKLEAEAAA